MSRAQLLTGDALAVLRTLPDGVARCCVTSPPYFGLRDYGVAGQIGLERTPEEYVARLVAVFREVRRALTDDGTLWLVLGDSYAGSGKGAWNRDDAQKEVYVPGVTAPRIVSEWPGLKPKDLVGIPWLVAFALRQPYYTGRIARVEDRIWLACAIEAEGCIFIHKRRVGQSNGQGYERKNDSYGSGLEVANTSEAFVRRCCEIAGIGSICHQDKGRKQRLFRWSLRSNECRDILREVYPYLVAKQQQARLAIGCPSSGERAAAAHAALIGLHGGSPSDVDFAAPSSLLEPGFYLRSDVIWSKLNPMPESVTDRPTRSHEYVFLLSKAARYYYDAEAVAEPCAESQLGRLRDDQIGGSNGQKVRHSPGGRYKTDKQRGHGRRHAGFNDRWDAMTREEQCSGMRNARSVWEIATQPYPEAHFATFPEELARRCILAGSAPGDTVLDPFSGSGTVAQVATGNGRNAIGIELNPAYQRLAEQRIGPLLVAGAAGEAPRG